MSLDIFLYLYIAIKAAALSLRVQKLSTPKACPKSTRRIRNSALPLRRFAATINQKNERGIQVNIYRQLDIIVRVGLVLLLHQRKF